MADETPYWEDEAVTRDRVATGDLTIGLEEAAALLREVDRLRAREAAAMAIVVELARQDETRGINCLCRETMPTGHREDCYVFRAHMIAHQLPDGSYE